jgi:preprotein translocase subunit SecD
MNFCTRRFNLYLLAAVAGLLAAGCAHLHGKDKDKPVGLLRVHIESEAGGAGTTKTITVLRSEPVAVNIMTQAILSEADLTSARLLEAPGGCAVEIKFDNAGSWTLEQFTASNPGKHLAIFGQWSEKPEDGRWLAAPLIVHRMASGGLVFTPDASHEEMEKLVKGLNAYIKKNNDSKAK